MERGRQKGNRVVHTRKRDDERNGTKGDREMERKEIGKWNERREGNGTKGDREEMCRRVRASTHQKLTDVLFTKLHTWASGVQDQHSTMQQQLSTLLGNLHW